MLSMPALMTTTPSPPTTCFAATHSPRGANASFTLGLPGRHGGNRLHRGRIVPQDVFIGAYHDGIIRCLPFFAAEADTGVETFLGEMDQPIALIVTPYQPDAITREYRWGTDTWRADDLTFRIATPVAGVPDPATASRDAMRAAVAPALSVQLTFDNRGHDAPMEGFFAIGQQYGIRLLHEETDDALCGIVTADGFGMAIDAASYPQAQAIVDFSPAHVFSRPVPLPLRVASMGGIRIPVAADTCLTVDIALTWYVPGKVTHGRDYHFAYTDCFIDHADVLRFALDHGSIWWGEAEAADRRLIASGLSDDQQFLLAQATRAYYTSTKLLRDAAGTPLWIVEEGSFAMFNTLDLTVDHLFFELREHPWAVRNVLDFYADHYSYTDTVHLAGDTSQSFPGGLAFAHDHGISDTFSPTGMSSYEIANQPGCFSYMTHEELLNWLLCAALYVHHTSDVAWAARHRVRFRACLDSLLNRDHPDPTQRDGIMDLDSDRCGTAGEITTYDSLDPNLGQARRNLYLGVKTWAGYIALGHLLADDETARGEAQVAAERAARTIADAFVPALGYIPAILGSDDAAPIIPAIEGLVYCAELDQMAWLVEHPTHGHLIDVLRAHLMVVLQPDCCRFPDGGWRLSARSVNSWMSKIFLCQHIARDVLGCDFGAEGQRADRAHASWWQHGCADDPGIDQVFAGMTTEGDFHYPRAITSILWLKKTEQR